MFDNDGHGLSFFQGFPTHAPFPWVRIVCLSLFVDSCSRAVASCELEIRVDMNCAYNVLEEMSPPLNHTF